MRPSPTWISNMRNVTRKQSGFTWTKFYAIKCFKRSLARCNLISLRHSQRGPRYSECWQWAFLWYTTLKVIANIQCLLTSCQEQEKCRCKNKKKYLEPEASTHRQNYINASLERNMVRFISLVSSFLGLGLVSPLNASVTRSRLLHFSPTLVQLKQKVLIPAATLLSFVPGRQMNGPPVAARKSLLCAPRLWPPRVLFRQNGILSHLAAEWPGCACQGPRIHRAGVGRSLWTPWRELSAIQR